MKCQKHNVEELVNNRNTGIEYEYGIACALMTEEQYYDFFKSVISGHKYEKIIVDICKSAKLTLAPLIEGIDCKEKRYISLVSTQNDSLGPSDVLVCCNNEIEFGISVKKGNINNWNPSSKHFIDKASISSFRHKYNTYYLPKYIQDMHSRFGKCETVKGTKNTWSRKRSEVTDAFIDLIREKVIKNWYLKSTIEKQEIVDSGYQLFSPIDYYVINIKGSNNKCKLSSPKPALYSVEDLTLEKYKESYVAFKVEGKTIVKLQVKFNNGFLEKVKSKAPSKTIHSFKIDTIYFKNGDPFGSWNFNIL